MLKENKHKLILNQCPFTSVPLSDAYKKICSLNAPYLWVKYSNQNEELYYIDDIQTFVGVYSAWWNNSGWDLPGSCDDIIRLHLVRIQNDKKHFIKRDILFHWTNPKYETTADQLIESANLRIPTLEELLNVEFEDGIPGHMTTKEEKEAQIKEKIDSYEKELQSLRLQNELCSDMIKQLTLKIEHNNLRISSKERLIQNAKTTW